MIEPLRILLIEDDEADAELTRYALQKGGFELDWARVDTADDMRRALADNAWDIVISDFSMPRFDGLEAFAIFIQHRLDIPFIFVSGALGEERAVEAMRRGAHDYHLKGALGRLAVAVRRELRASENRRSQRAAEELARLHQRRLALAVEASGVAIFECDVPPAAQPYVADRCLELLGLTRADLPPNEDLATWLRQRIHPDDRGALDGHWRRFLVGELPSLAFETRLQHLRGDWIDLDVRGQAIERAPDGRVRRMLGVLLDLTERKRLESHLRQTQKMEAVGRLAGGVAHDFNNLLTAIFSFGTFVLESLPEGDPSRPDQEEVLAAARRAAALTDQLLAFSRLKSTAPRVVAVNDVILSCQRMLGRLIGEDVEVTATLHPSDLKVKIDPGELEQVLMNLCVNARDAGTRRVIIETGPFAVDEPMHGFFGTQPAPGNYVQIAVTDEGSGMDQATVARVFEPFFTTKEVGRGTGLGLATSYGIVQRAGGFFWVYSELGRGTTFKVFLPRAAGSATSRPVPRPPRPPTGNATVLVVEDDEPVRRLAVRALERFGYRVLAAGHGEEALAVARAFEGPIALLLTDVVMPGLSGRELAEQMVALRPDTRVVYMSGYAPAAILQRGVLAAEARMIQKPFAPDVLAREVAAALEPDPGPVEE